MADLAPLQLTEEDLLPPPLDSSPVQLTEEDLVSELDADIEPALVEAPEEPIQLTEEDLAITGEVSEEPIPQPSPETAVAGAGKFRLPMPQPEGRGKYDHLLEEPTPQIEIPGLKIAGARISALPPELSEDPPPSFLENKGKLTRDEISAMWAETAYVYNRSKDPMDRVKALGDFMRSWDPDAAERIGLTDDGYLEPEGVFWALDRLDKYTARPVRASLNTLYDLRKWYAAAELSDEIEGPSLSEVGRMLSRNFNEDKGTLEDGEKVMKSMAMYATSLAMGLDGEESAKALFDLDANWAGEADDLAKSLTSFGWSAAKPLVKAVSGVDEASFQHAKAEAVEAKAGGHMAIGLLGLMGPDMLNFIGVFGAKPSTNLSKVAEDTAKSLVGGGVDLTRKGEKVLGDYTLQLESQARGILIEDLKAIHPAEDISKLTSLSEKIKRVDETIDGYKARAVEGKGPNPIEAAKAAVPALTDFRGRLFDQFDEVYDSLALRDVAPRKTLGVSLPQFLPAKQARAAIDSRLRILAVADFNNAVDSAFKWKVPLAGDFVVAEHAKLQAIAKMDEIPLGEMNQQWATVVREADNQGKVLVKAIPRIQGKTLTTVTGVAKDPAVAALYKRAGAGEFGPAGRVAALRPEYDALESLLKRGAKGVDSYEDLVKTARESLENEGRVFRDMDKALTFRQAEDGTSLTGRAVEKTAKTIRGLDPTIPKELRSKGSEVLKRQSLVGDLAPASFLLAQAIGAKVPWFDRLRRTTAGIMYLRGPGKMQSYITKGDDGRYQAIPREQLVHPGLHYKAQKAERQRLRARNVLMSRWPETERKLKAITSNPKSLQLARHYVEMGWADTSKVEQVEREILTATALRELSRVAQEISDSVEDLKVTGPQGRNLGSLQILSPEDTRKAVAAIEALKASAGDGPLQFDAAAIDELASEIQTYGDAVESQILGPTQAREAWKKGGALETERIDNLIKAKGRIDFFNAAYKAKINSDIGVRTELEVASMADEFTPEIQRLQGGLIEIEKSLSAKKGEFPEATGEANVISDILAQAQETIPDFRVGDVVPLKLSDSKPRWAVTAAEMSKSAPESLVNHMDGVYRELRKHYPDKADADIVMNRLQVFADMAVRQGAVNSPEEYFYQFDFKVGGEAPAEADGMLFHHQEVAPVFYSQLKRAIDGQIFAKDVAKQFKANSLVERLTSSGVSAQVIEDLDIAGWLKSKHEDHINHPRIPENRKQGWEDFRVKRKELEDYIESKSVAANSVLRGLDGGTSPSDVLPLKSLRSELQRRLVKPREMDASSVDSLLGKLEDEGKTTITRQELADLIEPRLVKLDDDVRGYFHEVTSKREAPRHRLDKKEATAVVTEFAERLESGVREAVDGPFFEMSDEFDSYRPGTDWWKSEEPGTGTIEVAYYPTPDAWPATVREFSPEELGLTVAEAERAEAAHWVLMDESRMGFDEATEPIDPTKAVWDIDSDAFFTTSPGGEKNSELLIVNRESDVMSEASAGHYAGVSGIETHIRFNIRTDKAGRRVLYIEEIQSDNGQALAKLRKSEKDHKKVFKIVGDAVGKELVWEGGRGRPTSQTGRLADEASDAINKLPNEKLKELLYDPELRPEVTMRRPPIYGGVGMQTRDGVVHVVGRRNEVVREIVDSLHSADEALGAARSEIPKYRSMSHQIGWQDLALKRMLHFAINDADEAIDAIAWTRGETQRVRYADPEVPGSDNLGALVEQYDVSLPKKAKRLFEKRGAKADSFEFDVTDSFDEARAKVQAQYAPGETLKLSEEISIRPLRTTLRKLDDTAPLVDGKRTLEAHGFEITDELRASIEKDKQALFQKEKDARRGMMKVLEDDRVLVQAFKNATPATPVHEIAHVLRRNLANADQLLTRKWLLSEAERFRSDINAIPKDLAYLFPEGKVGEMVNEAGEFTRAGEELFARGFETYLATNKLPAGAPKSLEAVFKRLKEWMVAAYEHIAAQTGVKLNREMTDLFDRYLLGGEVKVEQNPNWKKRRVDTGLSEEAHFAEVSAALKRGEDVPIEVLLDYPSAKIGEIQKLMKRDLSSINHAASLYKKALRKLANAEKDLESATNLGAAFKTKGVVDARRAAEKAHKSLKSVTTPKEFRRLSRSIEGVKRAKEAKNLAAPVGSKERHMLEATRELYRNRMAAVVGQIQDDAYLIRENAEAQKAVMFDEILPKGQLSAQGRRRVDDATDAMRQIFSKGEPAVPKLDRQRVDKMLKKMADPKLSERIAKSRRRVAATKDVTKRAAAEAKLNEKLSEMFSGMEARVAEGVKLTPLDEAIARVSGGRVTSGMPGKAATREELVAKAKNVDEELEAFIEALDDLSGDLRHPKDVRRDLESAIESSYNNLEKVGFEFEERLRVFKDSETARMVEGMSKEQIGRVTRMVKDPKHHDLLIGKAETVTQLASRLEKTNAAIQKMETEGKDTSRLVSTKGDLEEKLTLLGDPEEAQKILEAARLIKKFFDNWKEDLASVGILDDLDIDEFFRRVDVAGYIPHMLSEAGAAKVSALRGKGMLPSRSTPNFAKLRKMGGTIDEINMRMRDELSEQVIQHQAKRGMLGEEARQAEARGELKEFLDETAEANGTPNYAETIESARIQFGLEEVYDFFETDTLALMERYNSMASRTVADAGFIEDILDLFPMGRQFSQLYKSKTDADAAASLAGYVRLDKVSHLESVLRTSLPKKLREFEPYIRNQLDKGVPYSSIADELAKAGVDVDIEVLGGFGTKDVYVPTQIAEYLNWKNSSDGWYADSQFGKMADSVHSWMKAQSTIVAFAHIMRNVIGNVVSSAQELGWAAANPVTQVQAMRIWGSWGVKHPDAIVKIGKNELKVKEWKELFQERGFFEAPLSSEFMRESSGMGGIRELPTARDLSVQLGMSFSGAAVGGAVGAMFGVAPAGVFAGVAGSLMARRAWKASKSVQGNPSLTRFFKGVVDEIKKAPGEAISGGLPGLVIGTTAGPVGAIAGATIGAATMSDYMKMMGGLNSSVEAQARVSMAIGALKKGKSIDEAIESVNAALRDYSDLSPFEKNVLRRIFFFYTWEAGNIKFQLDWLRRRPRTANMIGSFMNAVYKEQFDEREIAAIPENWRYRVILRSGASKMIALSGLPQESALDILTRGKRPFVDALVQRINPAPLSMLELLIGGGRSVYYGRGWDELTNVRGLKNAPPGLKWAVGFPEEGDETWTPVYKDGVEVGSKPVYKAANHKLFYLMQRFPGWRVINQYMTLAADTFNAYALDAGDESSLATPTDRALMFGVGYRITSIDMEQQMKLLTWRIEKALIEEIDKRQPRAVMEIQKLSPEWSAEEMPVELESNE